MILMAMAACWHIVPEVNEVFDKEFCDTFMSQTGGKYLLQFNNSKIDCTMGQQNTVCRPNLAHCLSF